MQPLSSEMSSTLEGPGSPRVCKTTEAYVLSSPAFVLAPVAVVSCPKLLAEDQPNISCLAAIVCDTKASTSKHARLLISLDEGYPWGLHGRNEVCTR